MRRARHSPAAPPARRSAGARVLFPGRVRVRVRVRTTSQFSQTIKSRKFTLNEPEIMGDLETV